MKSISLVLALVLAGMSAQAEVLGKDKQGRKCYSEAPRGTRWDICKQTNLKAPLPFQYLIASNHDMYAVFKKSNSDSSNKYYKCQVTNNVTDVKNSSNDFDENMAYYVRSGDLYRMKKVTANGNDCPSFRDVDFKIMGDVKEYKMVSDSKSDIVSMAVDTHGNLMAWNYDAEAFQLKNVNIKDFEINNCFKETGKSFNSYVAFAINKAGNVYKIKAEEKTASSGRYEYFITVPTTEAYGSIDKFQAKEKVCK